MSSVSTIYTSSSTLLLLLPELMLLPPPLPPLPSFADISIMLLWLKTNDWLSRNPAGPQFQTVYGGIQLHGLSSYGVPSLTSMQMAIVETSNLVVPNMQITIVPSIYQVSQSIKSPFNINSFCGFCSFTEPWPMHGLLGKRGGGSRINRSGSGGQEREMEERVNRITVYYVCA